VNVCVCVWVGVCVYVCVCERERERERESVRIVCRSVNVGQGLMYRVTKTHRMPYPYRSFSAQEPYN